MIASKNPCVGRPGSVCVLSYFLYFWVFTFHFISIFHVFCLIGGKTFMYNPMYPISHSAYPVAPIPMFSHYLSPSQLRSGSEFRIQKFRLTSEHFLCCHCCQYLALRALCSSVNLKIHWCQHISDLFPFFILIFIHRLSAYCHVPIRHVPPLVACLMSPCLAVLHCPSKLHTDYTYHSLHPHSRCPSKFILITSFICYSSTPTKFLVQIWSDTLPGLAAFPFSVCNLFLYPPS